MHALRELSLAEVEQVSGGKQWICHVVYTDEGPAMDCNPPGSGIPV